MSHVQTVFGIPEINQEVRKAEEDAMLALQRAQVAMSYLNGFWSRYGGPLPENYPLRFRMPPDESEIHAAKVCANTVAKYVTSQEFLDHAEGR